jgi:hypothetical protein
MGGVKKVLSWATVLSVAAGSAETADRFAGNETRLGEGLPPVFPFRPDQVFRLRSSE